jgi:hypothetical protein
MKKFLVRKEVDKSTSDEVTNNLVDSDSSEFDLAVSNPVVNASIISSSVTTAKKNSSNATLKLRQTVIEAPNVHADPFILERDIKQLKGILQNGLEQLNLLNDYPDAADYSAKVNTLRDDLYMTMINQCNNNLPANKKLNLSGSGVSRSFSSSTTVPNSGCARSSASKNYIIVDTDLLPNNVYNRVTADLCANNKARKRPTHDLMTRISKLCRDITRANKENAKSGKYKIVVPK